MLDKKSLREEGDMKKVVFVNLYEFSYLGTRILAAYLQKHGFVTHNILLDDMKDILIEEPSEDYIGYHFYQGGNLYEHPAVHNPFTAKEFQLLETTLREECPDIIGFSARSMHNHLVPSLISTFKKAVPQALLVAGGFGPTLNPEIYLEGGFDVVVQGDGEEAILALAQHVQNHNSTSMLNINNTIWSEKWGGTKNTLRDQEKDLSNYCAPLRGNAYFSYIINGELHRNSDPILNGYRYFTFFGRGCTGKCTYCSGGQWSSIYREQGKKAYKRRNRDIQSLIDELVSLPGNIDRRIVFSDEYWALSKEKSKEFFKLYKEKVGLPFWVYLDYEQMVNNPDLFNLVLDAGLHATGIGFQTGSGEFAKKYYNRIQKYDTLIKYANMLFRNGIFINPQFIGGNCYETWDDFYKTVDIVKSLPFSIETPFSVYIQSTQLKIHPKTPLTIIAPRTVTNPMSSKEWFYRAILIEISRIKTKDALEEIINDKTFKQNPVLLNKFFKHELLKKQTEHFIKLVDETRRQDWVFYGINAAYHKNKNFFADLKPQAILVDSIFYRGEKEVDGIPVIPTEEFFIRYNGTNFNFLIFTSSSFFVAKKLLRTYKVPFDNIHYCTSNFLSPFSADQVNKDNYHV